LAEGVLWVSGGISQMKESRCGVRILMTNNSWIFIMIDFKILPEFPKISGIMGKLQPVAAKEKYSGESER
jgi:hypothetical protein